MASIELHGVQDSVSTDEYGHVLDTSKAAFEEAFALYNDPGFDAYIGWRKEAETENATVHTRAMPYGKLFALRAKVAWGVQHVFQEQWLGLDNVASWNENIVFSSTLKRLTDNVDIVHYANKDVFMVKSRDYVVSRIRRQVGSDCYLIARSVEVPELIEGDSGRVRAVIHMGAGRFRPHPEDDKATQLDYMLSIDFGGFIPKSIINTVMAKLVIKDFEETRKHLESLKETQQGQR